MWMAGKKRRIKIGIRPQLIILVCFLSLFSLLILAIVCGVFFSKNLSNLRADRLEVISQLKATQVEQTLQYIYYQVYWLSRTSSITKPLLYYRAGNKSSEVFADAQLNLNSFLSTSETFASARLYDLDLLVVALSYNSAINVSTPVQDALYPLAANLSVPDAITITDDSNAFSPGYLTGPLPNSTATNLSYFLGISVPVYSNTSIIVEEPSIAGYLTVIANSQTVQSALDVLSGAEDYNVVAVRAIYYNTSTTGDNSYLIGFETIYPLANGKGEPNVFYPISASESVRTALTKVTGTATKVKSASGTTIAMGFTRVKIDPSNIWSILIEQKRSKFLAPVKKLTDIMIGVVIGIGVFMCLITFPLAMWFVIPITKLKEATEAITRSKKEKDSHGGANARLMATHSPDKSTEGLEKRRSSDALEKSSGKRNSVNTVSSGSSTVYSTGIRLPARIPQSKKLFKDELTELSEAFNIMTGELEKQYSHLEDRVKMRTKELEASKVEAEAANEAKTVFIANISHELRTPLNGILGMTSIAMEETDQGQIQDSLKLIHRSGELLLHILTELLTFSKNTLNRAKLEKSNFQILEVVHQVRSIFGKLALDQRVNFKITLKPNIMRKLILFGDSNRIIQVVMNLVSNSLKFTPVDGSVDVCFKLLGEYDLAASQAIDHERVCVKRDSAKSTPHGAETEIPDPHEENPAELVSEFNGFYSTTTRERKNSISALRKDSAVDPLRKNSEVGSIISSRNDLNGGGDNSSIVTITTQEYDNAVFQSQFSYLKPLPRLPSRHSSPLTSPSASNTSLPEPNPNLASPQKVPNESIQNLYSADHKTIETTAVESDEKRPPKVPIMSLRKNSSQSFYASTNHFSNSELVKNSHVYKMRKLYVPKSWVIQIEVRDTGSGIEPALQEKVFEPFIQGDQTLSRSYGGTGLGLSICRQLAKMMNGTLTLKSTIGKGSTFTFTLPLPQSGEIVVPPELMEDFSNDEFNPNSKVNRKVVFDIAQPSIVEESAQNSPTSEASEHSPTVEKSGHFKKPVLQLSLGGSSTGTVNQQQSGDTVLKNISHLRILVAEDNSVNQEVIKRMLRLEGFTNLTMAANGAEAVDLVQQSYDSMELYDLIFMDVQMPKMDGLTATKLIRNNLRYHKPIIALTAFADESNVKECLNSGMSGFLSKPIKRTNLRKIITEYSPDLLSDIVTTPLTITDDDEERRLGYLESLPQHHPRT